MLSPIHRRDGLARTRDLRQAYPGTGLSLRLHHSHQDERNRLACVERGGLKKAESGHG